MVGKELQKRIDNYSELSTALAYLDNLALTGLFKNTLDTSKGWGTNHILQMCEHKFFVKRIPLSDLHHEHPYSTKNWHRLPAFYNYPVGSAGINPFRELAAHIKTTNWVLSGQCVHFPLLYHHRIVPCQPDTTPINEEGFRHYLARWGDHEQVREYMLARRHAKQELILFLEYFPHELGEWFQDNVTTAASIEVQMKEVLRFMHSQKFLHCDLTFNNMVTDGELVYLVDFGMSLDWGFELGADERAFFEQHALFDFGMFLKSVAFYAITKFSRLPDEVKGKATAEFKLSGASQLTGRDKVRLITMLESLAESGYFPLDQGFVDFVLHYQAIILLMQGFIGEMLENNAKDTVYQREELARLLRASRFFTP